MIRIQMRLNKLRRQAKPSRAFTQALWAQLLKEYEEAYPSQSSITYFRMATFATAMLVLLFVSATSVYAYESPAVTEGSVLYPIKNSLEEIQKPFAFTTAMRSEYHLRMLRRRMSEAEYSVEQSERVRVRLERIVEELDRAVKTIEAQQTRSTRSAALRRLSTVSDRYAALLEGVFKKGEPTEDETAESEFTPVIQHVREIISSSSLSEDEKGLLFRRKWRVLLEE